ncbi:MAG: TetR/AcrR family transcriptional regulator [Myxococcaceae bacterium]
MTARGQRTRRRLLESAEAEFGKNGFEAASIADITRRAGVALGTFYVYFPDKRALFLEVVDNLGTRLRKHLTTAVMEHENRLTAQREGIRAFLQFAGKNRWLYRLIRQAEFVDEACYRRYYASIAGPYAQRLSAAMGAGRMRKVDPETLAWCLMGLADFLGMKYVLWRNPKKIDQVLDAAMDFIENGLAAPPTKEGRSPTR